MALAQFYTHRQQQQFDEIVLGVKEKETALAAMQEEHSEYRRIIEEGRQAIADAKAESEVRDRTNINRRNTDQMHCGMHLKSKSLHTQRQSSKHVH
jgi:hypothetical protein